MQTIQEFVRGPFKWLSVLFSVDAGIFHIPTESHTFYRYNFFKWGMKHGLKEGNRNKKCTDMQISSTLEMNVVIVLLLILHS